MIIALLLSPWNAEATAQQMRIFLLLWLVALSGSCSNDNFVMVSVDNYSRTPSSQRDATATALQSLAARVRQLQQGDYCTTLFAM